MYAQSQAAGSDGYRVFSTPRYDVDNFDVDTLTLARSYLGLACLDGCELSSFF